MIVLCICELLPPPLLWLLFVLWCVVAFTLYKAQASRKTAYKVGQIRQHSAGVQQAMNKLTEEHIQKMTSTAEEQKRKRRVHVDQST